MSKLKSKMFWVPLLIFVLGGAFWAYFIPGKPAGPAYIEVKLERKDITLEVEATGTVQPENRLEIKLPVAGRIEEVMVSEGTKVKKGSVLAWMSSSERAALLDSAASLGPEEVKRWKDLYKATPILSPIAGTIILRKAEPGQSFTLQDAIMVIADRLVIKATIDETDLAQVSKNQVARITLDAYAKDPIGGVVTAIAYEAAKVNNVTTYQVSIAPDSTPNFMRSGMTASVAFVGETKTNISTLPTEAIRFKEGKKWVLAGDIKKPQEKEITTGVTNGKFTEVLSGLSPGEGVYLESLELNAKAEGSNPFMPSRFGGKKPKK
jgi:macrolide-specific efflux system membrane fusion protein